jgi:hypothetical protein
MRDILTYQFLLADQGKWFFNTSSKRYGFESKAGRRGSCQKLGMRFLVNVIAQAIPHICYVMFQFDNGLIPGDQFHNW